MTVPRCSPAPGGADLPESTQDAASAYSLRLEPWEHAQNRAEGILTDPLTTIERILNTHRWKYLKGIALSPKLRNAPAQAVSATFNNAFKSLIGIEVEDGGWQSRGFDPRAKYELDWDRSLEELGSALARLTQPHTNRTQAYAELIALKPGFHEAWCHEDFPNDVQENPDSPRGRVFAILRGGPEPLIDMEGGFPEGQLEAKAFLAYAACAITEGPCHLRRNDGVEYLGSLLRLATTESRETRQNRLLESFRIFDFRARIRRENASESLCQIVNQAAAFSGCA